MTDDSARVYMFAVEDFSLEAIKRACRQLVRGEVKGRNNSFAPSAPELAELCRFEEGQLKVEQYEADRFFVEEGSELWRKMLIHRKGSSAPTFKRDGKAGWFFSKEEVVEADKIALAPPVTEEQQRLIAEKATALAGVKSFNVADEDGFDMGDKK